MLIHFSKNLFFIYFGQMGSPVTRVIELYSREGQRVLQSSLLVCACVSAFFVAIFWTVFLVFQSMNWLQKPKQTCSGSSLNSCLLWEDAEAFPAQRYNLSSVLLPWGHLSVGHANNASLGRCPGDVLSRCSAHHQWACPHRGQSQMTELYPFVSEGEFNHTAVCFHDPELLLCSEKYIYFFI